MIDCQSLLIVDQVGNASLALCLSSCSLA